MEQLIEIIEDTCRNIKIADSTVRKIAHTVIANGYEDCTPYKRRIAVLEKALDLSIASHNERDAEALRNGYITMAEKEIQ